LSNANVRIYEIKIADIIEEGTKVEKGDYIASLDHKIVEEVLNTARLELEDAIHQFEDARMDSNLNLSNSRDQILNDLEQVEQMRIILEESVYESPSVIRKAEMDLEKAQRIHEQDILAYKIKTQQAITRVNRRVVFMNQKENRVRDLEIAYRSLDIHAPKPGMVIYAKDRFGEKTKTGSTISRWMPVIATLPDLTKMISVTYVNEIDISKIRTGQKVTIGIDAFPGKKMEGEVIALANIGQLLPKSDAKVFEVKIRLYGSDPDLRPAMTTSNVIRTGTYSNEIFIPSDAIFNDDSLKYVFVWDDSPVKQIVETGPENENFTVIKQGLQPGSRILLTPSVHGKDLPFRGMEIYYRMKKEKEEKANAAKTALSETETSGPVQTGAVSN
jgi:multidrug efflux pump subunit AcrA (membrane-fusion protein)